MTTDPVPTPPATGQVSGAVDGGTSSDGPVSGNRTPMVITLTVLGVLVVMLAVLVGASFIPS